MGLLHKFEAQAGDTRGGVWLCASDDAGAEPRAGDFHLSRCIDDRTAFTVRPHEDRDGRTMAGLFTLHVGDGALRGRRKC